MNKVYVTGNYFFLELNGSTKVLQDAKSNVTVVVEDETAQTFRIFSDTLGEHVLALSTLENESSVAYTETTWETFYYNNTGFNAASGGSGAGIDPNHIFEGAGTDASDFGPAETVRDAYFTTNPTQRTIGVLIMLVNTFPDPDVGQEQRWSGSAWVDINTVLSPSEIKTLYESNPDTNDYNDAAETKVNHLTVTEDVNIDTLKSDVSTNNAKNTYPSGDATKVGNITVTQDVNLDTMQSTLTSLGMSFISWNFSDQTTGLNPGAGNFALNNALKDDATEINYNTISAVGNARFDEFLTGLDQGIYIFIRERNATNTSILYRINGTTTTDQTRVDIPVTRVRDQGGEFTLGAVCDFHFLANTEAMRGVLGGMITVSDEGVQLTANVTSINFTGAGVAAAAVDGAVSVVIPGAGGAFAAPSIHNFSIDIPSRVDINTDLNQDHIFTFDVTNRNSIASIEAIVVNGNNVTLTNPTTDGTQNQTHSLSGIDSSTSKTVTITLRATDTNGGTHDSNTVSILIQNAQSDEQTHFGTILSTEDQTDINFTNDDITARDSKTGDWTVSGIPSGSNLYRVYWAVPVADGNITRVAQGGFTLYDVNLASGNQFTLMPNVTIDGNAHNVLLMNVDAAVNNNYNGTVLTTS